MVALKEIARAYSAHHSERSCSGLAPAPEWWTATPSRSLLQVGCAHLESRWSRFDLSWALGDHSRAHRWAGARGRPHAKGAGSGAAVGPPEQQGRASICARWTLAGKRCFVRVQSRPSNISAAQFGAAQLGCSGRIVRVRKIEYNLWPKGTYLLAATYVLRAVASPSAAGAALSIPLGQSAPL